MFTRTARQSQPRRRKLGRAAVLCATVAALGVAGGAAQGDNVADEDELPTYPERGVYVGVRASSINYATAAKQWIRLPPLFVSAYNRRSAKLEDRRCLPPVGRLFPYQEQVDRHATMHFRSSPGTPAAYGYIGPFTVRAVAFGSIPVQAHVQLRQLRDSESKSVGLDVKANERKFCLGQGPIKAEVTDHVSAADASGELEVAVTGIEVDGVDLKLRDTCKTSEPAALRVSSTEYFWTGQGTTDPKRFYVRNGSGLRQLTPDEEPYRGNLFTTPVFNLSSGGLLTGNVEIPPFRSCLTENGEDVSKLLTTTIAGSDNPVVVRAEGLDSPPTNDPLPGLPFPTATP